MLAVEYHVHIWQVSPQLSCGDTCQIWMRFKEYNRYFCQIENFAYGEIDERSFSNPHPWSDTGCAIKILNFDWSPSMSHVHAVFISKWDAGKQAMEQNAKQFLCVHSRRQRRRVVRKSTCCFMMWFAIKSHGEVSINMLINLRNYWLKRRGENSLTKVITMTLLELHDVSNSWDLTICSIVCQQQRIHQTSSLLAICQGNPAV